MPLAKCARCQKLFDKTGTPVCSACLPDEERDYERVREYLATNPEANADAIGEMLQMDVQCILRMVDQGLVISSMNAGKMVCGRCGAPAISATKRLCNSCLEELNREVARQRSKIQMNRQEQPSQEKHVSVQQTLEAKRAVTQ